MACWDEGLTIQNAQRPQMKTSTGKELSRNLDSPNRALEYVEDLDVVAVWS